jgi:hypothetical protein
MPLSPFTRLLWLLTALVFPLVFLALEARNPWVANTLLGIALLLLLAAVYLTIRSGGAFDQRAFHLTRPQGTGRVFRQQTLIWFGAAAGVALLAVARGYWFNLGWRAAWAAGLIVWVLVLLIIAAAATGFTLAMGRSRATARVAALLLGVPVGLQLWLMEAAHRSPGTSVVAWTSNLNLGGVIALVGYLLAWWLAAGRRNWWGSLLVAAGAGASLPLLANQGPLLGHARAPLTGATVRIERLAAFRDLPGKDKSAFKLLRPVGECFRVSGLQPDEFLSLSSRLPMRDESYPRSQGGERAESVLLMACFRDDSIPKPESGWSTPLAVCGDLPGWPLDQIRPRHGGDSHVKVNEAAASRVEQADWVVGGEVRRIERLGAVPLFEGGRLDFPSGGCIRISPARRGRDERGNEDIQFEALVTVPDGRLAELAIENPPDLYSYYEHCKVVVVAGNGRRAFVTFLPERPAIRSGLGSWWERNRVSVKPASDLAGWSTADIAGAKVHCFLTYPVDQLKQVLTPPRN